METEPSLFDLLAYGDTGFGDELLRGVKLTIQLSVCGYAIGFFLGLAGAGAKLSGNKALMRCGDVYTTIVRALPELLLILILYYTGTSTLKNLLIGIGWASEDFEINAFAAAVAALGFISGAYMTEVLRGAIQSIPKGQIEAARAFGMPFFLRFRRIIFPQMIRYALPGMGNLWLNITKDSSLVSVLGAFADTLKSGTMAASATKHYLFFYSVTALLFLTLTVGSMALLGLLERRVNRGVRRA
jgi:polar amino acid transport system permease protein